MSRRSIAVACATALVASAAVWALWPGSAGATASRMTFFSPYNQGESHEIDADSSGSETPGDYFVGSFVLNKRGDRSGHFEFQCTRVMESPPRDQCLATARIKGRGYITVQNVGPPDEGDEDIIRAAVTGGSGEFVGASGTVTIEFKRTGARVTFNLR